MEFDNINVGAVYSFDRVITEGLVADFAALSGDYNPLHMEDSFARKSPFGRRVAHGMLAASFFSTLVGMYCPGEHALYMQQTVQFHHPLFLNDAVTVRGIVMERHESVRLIKMKTEIIREGQCLITGEALVKYLSYDA